MPTVADITNSTLPNAQGKLKALWDAVRTMDPASAPQPAPTLSTATIAAQPTPEYQAPSGPAQDPFSPPPVPVAAMSPPQTPQLPEPAEPPVTLAPPPVASLPGSQRVTDLQGQLDQANAPPTLKQKLMGMIPLGAGLATAAIARGNSGGIIAGVNKGQEIAREQGNVERQNLTTQLAGAQSEREKEYDVAQRTVEQANAAHEASQSRREVARILGGSREAVADTNVGGRVAVAGTQGQTARDVASVRAGSAKTVAEIAADARIQAGKYAADAANGRLTRTLNAASGRQQAGFTHTDTKPTADEDRRADLAKSLSDIGDEVSGIAARRPDLFGPAAGRWASLKTMVGTSDPDLAALHADKEALGQIALGAHAMRNASHIAVAANSIINNFNNQPEAIIAGIETAKHNANTMQTIVRPTLVGQVKPGQAAPRSAPAASSAAEPDYIYQVGKGLVPNPKAKR